MKPEAKVFLDGGQFSFDIVDTDDILQVGDDTLPELLHTGGQYTREQTAERNAQKWVDRWKAADEAGKRQMLGYDPVGDCTKRHVPNRPVLRRHH